MILNNNLVEKNINPEYLYQLNNAYNAWAKKEKSLKILTINTNNFNVFKDKDKLEDIYKLIEDSI